MKWEIKYGIQGFARNFYGDYGNMMVRNSMNGVLIQHDKKFYDWQERALGRKVIKDICNCLRSGYEPSLSDHYNSDDKKVFNELLDSKIVEAERKLKELKFAKKILSRKKIIFEKVEEI